MEDVVKDLKAKESQLKEVFSEKAALRARVNVLRRALKEEKSQNMARVEELSQSNKEKDSMQVLAQYMLCLYLERPFELDQINSQETSCKYWLHLHLIQYLSWHK